MGTTLDYLQSLYDEYISPELEFNGTCHDCGVPVQVVCIMADDGKLTIDGGALYKVEDIEKPFFKCPSCAEKKQELTDYQPCEVFSRVCGYLRPKKQYNKGKKAEFAMRKNFKVAGGRGDISTAMPIASTPKLNVEETKRFLNEVEEGLKIPAHNTPTPKLAEAKAAIRDYVAKKKEGGLK